MVSGSVERQLFLTEAEVEGGGGGGGGGEEVEEVGSPHLLTSTITVGC